MISLYWFCRAISQIFLRWLSSDVMFSLAVKLFSTLRNIRKYGREYSSHKGVRDVHLYQGPLLYLSSWWWWTELTHFLSSHSTWYLVNIPGRTGRWGAACSPARPLPPRSRQRSTERGTHLTNTLVLPEGTPQYSLIREGGKGCENVSRKCLSQNKTHFPPHYCLLISGIFKESRGEFQIFSFLLLLSSLHWTEVQLYFLFLVLAKKLHTLHYHN